MTRLDELQLAEALIASDDYEWSPLPPPPEPTPQAAPAPEPQTTLALAPTVQTEPLMPLNAITARRCGLQPGVLVNMDEFTLALSVATGMAVTRADRKSRRWKGVRPHIWKSLRKYTEKKKTK